MTTAITTPISEIGEEGPAAEGRGGRREQDGGADHEAAADRDQHDQGREAAEDQDDRRPVEAVAGGQIAAKAP